MCEKIKNFFKENWVTIVLTVLFIVLFILLGRSCSNWNIEKENNKANIIALTDSVEYYKALNDNLVAEKTLLVGDIETLELANLSLSKELENMKVENARMAAHLDMSIKNIVHDTCWIIEKDSNVVTKRFNFNDEPYRKLSGDVAYVDSILKMKIDTDMVFADLNLAIEDNSIKVCSNNPYLTFNNIYGINVPEYEPTWCLVVGPSVNVGYGWGTDFKGGNCNGGLVASVGVSLTFGWNIVGVGKRIKKYK